MIKEKITKNGNMVDFREIQNKFKAIIKKYPGYGYIVFHKDDTVDDLFSVRLVK